MSRYILNVTDNDYKVAGVLTESFYTFSPKGSKFTKVKTITLYDTEKISKIVIKKLMIKYQKIITDLANLFESDDESADGYLILLGEVSKLKDLLQLKYKKFLQKELYDNFLEDLINISKALQSKIDEANIIKGR